MPTLQSAPKGNSGDHSAHSFIKCVVTIYSIKSVLSDQSDCSDTFMHRPVRHKIYLLDSAFGRGGSVNAEFAAELEGYEVISWAYAENSTIQQEASRFLKDVAHHGPVSLIGTCFGTLVALEIISMGPSVLEKAVFIGPLLKKTASLVASAAPITDAPKGQGEADVRPSLQLFFDSFFCEDFKKNNPREFRVYSALFSQYWSKPDRLGTLKNRLDEQMNYLSDISDKLRSFKFESHKKIFIVAGENDGFITREECARISDRFGWCLTTLPESGHAVHIERPKECGRLVRSILN